MRCLYCNYENENEHRFCIKCGKELEQKAEQSEELDGRYSLIRVIGKGGMGKVYMASDQRLNRLVAIKEMLLKEDSSSNYDDVLETFKKETDLLTSLSHQICQLFMIFSTKKTDGIL